MKFFNFIGNSIFAIYSALFKKKSQTHCVVQKYFTKDWEKIKKDVSKWGTKDLWGDFDLLIGGIKII